MTSRERYCVKLTLFRFPTAKLLKSNVNRAFICA